MTEEPTGRTALEDVRSRFLETEQRLQEAVRAIDEVRSSAETIATTRESLVAASERLATLSGSLTDLVSGLAANADELRQGVDAIRMGDPAETRRQIQELGEALSVSRAVTADQLDALEAYVSKANEATQSLLTGRLDAAVRRTRNELRIGFVVVAVLAATAAAAPFVVPAA
jgi:chromosome segregation ATPase